ncbi:hypothetical protein BJX61DRAFT_539361 [Aspergillus egyptiacus]|nr:hypothetical protein BJX61DRAFT_539361 [Aspergillus egyptiacus]
MTEAPSRRRWWTHEEDLILQEEVKNQAAELGSKHARNWSAIAERLPGRSNKDCRKRWTKISLSSRKGTWSGAEDHLLRKAVARLGFRWTKVAEMVGSRHPDQCAKRWRYSLDPNVKRSPWTPDEDEALVGAVQRIGRDWKEIGRQLFATRSTTDIKNRYVILSRRRDSPRQEAGTVQLPSSKCFSELQTPSPCVDLSISTPYSASDMFDLNTDDPVPSYSPDLHRCLLSYRPSLSLSDISVPWTGGTSEQTVSSNQVSCSSTPSAAVSSWDPSLFINYSHPESPSPVEVSETPSSSTLVLEDLGAETVNLVIDTLLRSNSKFGMRLYNTGL